MSDQTEHGELWATWPRYRKTRLTPARRIATVFDLPDHPNLDSSGDGFWVRTREGRLWAPYGAFLAVDSQGNFYPIAEDEFMAIYEPDHECSDCGQALTPEQDDDLSCEECAGDGVPCDECGEPTGFTSLDPGEVAYCPTCADTYEAYRIAIEAGWWP